MRSHGFPSNSSSSVSGGDSVSVNTDNVMVLVVPFISRSQGTEGLVTEQG